VNYGTQVPLPSQTGSRGSRQSAAVSQVEDAVQRPTGSLVNQGWQKCVIAGSMRQ
jgi:hypothetical protein